jgi:cystathionine beta-lyase/cystathionine gamma-synthase
MGAVVAAVMGLLDAGGIIVTHLDTYGGTTEFFNVDARRFGIDVHFEDILDVKILESTLSSLKVGTVKGLDVPPEKKKVLVFLETITNPVIREADVAAISAITKKYGALLVVDHTFATPLRERPLLQVCSLSPPLLHPFLIMAFSVCFL